MRINWWQKVTKSSKKVMAWGEGEVKKWWSHFFVLGSGTSRKRKRRKEALQHLAANDCRQSIGELRDLSMGNSIDGSLLDDHTTPVKKGSASNLLQVHMFLSNLAEDFCRFFVKEILKITSEIKKWRDFFYEDGSLFTTARTSKISGLKYQVLKPIFLS